MTIVCALNELKLELERDEKVRIFLKLKEQLNSNLKIKEINNKLENLRSELKKAKTNEEKVACKLQIDLLKNEYDSNPLIVNYKEYYEYVFDLLNEIKDCIE